MITSSKCRPCNNSGRLRVTIHATKSAQNRLQQNPNFDGYLAAGSTSGNAIGRQDWFRTACHKIATTPFHNEKILAVTPIGNAIPRTLWISGALLLAAGCHRGDVAGPSGTWPKT